jgi:hypothetical protein
MRYFFRRRIPELNRVLFIESGSRSIFENVLPRLYPEGSNMRADLITCYPGRPAAFRARQGVVWRVTDYAGPHARSLLLRQLAANRYRVAVMICSGEPIMTKWKWMLAARLPVKVLVVNENCDYFWLDYGSWRIIRHFILYRAGLSGASAVSTCGRLALFPFTIAYLLLYTAMVHLRRRTRKVHP